MVLIDVSPALPIASVALVRLATFSTISLISSPILAICAEAFWISSACDTAPFDMSSTALDISSVALLD